MTRAAGRGAPSGVRRWEITATRRTHGTSSFASAPSMSYSRCAISAVVSLTATTCPDSSLKRTMWREMPFGSLTMWRAGQSSSRTDHGSVSSWGSVSVAVMRRESGTLGKPFGNAQRRGPIPWIRPRRCGAA